jgi:hypothetical protein
MPLSDYPLEELFPRDLTKEERENPFMVLNDFFSYSHLPSIREQMDELLTTTVTGNYCKMLTRRERSDMLFFFEKLRKLIEACHILSNATERDTNKWKEKVQEFIAVDSEN